MAKLAVTHVIGPLECASANQLASPFQTLPGSFPDGHMESTGTRELVKTSITLKSSIYSG